MLGYVKPYHPVARCAVHSMVCSIGLFAPVPRLVRSGTNQARPSWLPCVQVPWAADSGQLPLFCARTELACRCGGLCGGSAAAGGTGTVRPPAAQVQIR